MNLTAGTTLKYGDAVLELRPCVGRIGRRTADSAVPYNELIPAEGNCFRRTWTPPQSHFAPEAPECKLAIAGG
jgi:hypothetical protein